MPCECTEMNTTKEQLHVINVAFRSRIDAVRMHCEMNTTKKEQLQCNKRRFSRSRIDAVRMHCEMNTTQERASFILGP